MSVEEIFNKGALQYDRHRQKVIPCFRDFYKTLVQLVPFEKNDAFSLLDLGAGTGLVTSLVLNVFPETNATLVDISEKMLEKARERFTGNHSVSFEVMDYAKKMPEGRFDVVVSALSIHHLDDPDKKILFKRIFETLPPGGMFIHAELAKGESDATDEFFHKSWHEHLMRTDLSPEQLIQIKERMAIDKPATLQNQLNWMKSAGFRDVDCFYKYYNFAVYAGKKTDER